MRVKIQRMEFVYFSNLLNTIKPSENDIWTVQFTNALAKTRRLIRNDLESLNEAVEEKFKGIKKEKEELDKELCEIKKGHDIAKEGLKALEPLKEKEDGSTRFIILFGIAYFQMYKVDSKYTIEEYENRFRKIMESHKDEIDEIQKFMEEEVSINVHSVKCQYVPEQIGYPDGFPLEYKDLLSLIIED